MPELQVGLAKVDITPPVGVELSGFGPFIERQSTDVLEPLYAKAIVFELEGYKAALVACDLIGVSAEITQSVRMELQERLGLSSNAVMLCCTHTHSGPATVELIGWGERDEKYVRRLPSLIASAVTCADARLKPARLTWGESRVEGLSRNRVEPGGPVEERVVVLGLSSDDNSRRPVRGFAAHFSCHPVVMCAGTHFIHGDFAGVAVNSLEKKLGLELGAFVQGAPGDINTVSVHKPQEEALADLRLLSAQFAEDIEQALRAGEEIRTDSLRYLRKAITLPQTKPDMVSAVRAWTDAQRLRNRGELAGYALRYQRFMEETHDRILKKLESGVPPGLRTEIQGFCIGDVLILAQPSELFFSFYQELRRRLAEKLPGKRLVLAGYANDYVGYIPSAASYDTAGRRFSYAAYFVPMIRGDYPFAQNVGEVLVEELVQLACELCQM